MAHATTARGALAFVTAGALAAPMLVAAGVPAYAADPPASGLIAEYLFDQDSGTSVPNTAPDASLGAATVVNGLATDWTGTSLLMRGGAKNSTGDWVELPDDILADAESATISMEVKPTQAMLNGFHFMWNVGNDSSATEYFFASLNCASGRSPLVGIKAYASEQLVQSGSCGVTANTWVNVTSVVDAAAGTASLYLNGTLAGTGSVDYDLSDIQDQSLNTIGRAPWPDPLFSGEVATFRVYDRALTGAEIADVSAADAEIHEADFAAQAQGILDGLDLADITTNTHIDLPTANGRVTWTTSDASVVAADGTVSAPAQGQANRTAELTATVSIRGAVASETITVTVTPSDETPSERLERLAGQFVVPTVVASGTELPAVPAGLTIDSVVAGEGVTLDGGALVSSAGAPVAATVTSTVSDDSGAEPVVRVFDVTVLPAGADEVLAYHRTPTSVAQANNDDVAYSMHLALEGESQWEPLFDNYGIFFPKTSQVPAAGGTTSSIVRSLKDPHLFYMEDGSFGVVSTRIARGGASDGTQASQMLLATSDDLLSYEQVGLVNVGVSSGVNDPAVVFDSARDLYVVTWTSDTGAPMHTTFEDLSNVATRGEVERGTVQILGDDAEGAGVANYASGNAIPVAGDIATGLETRFGAITNTGGTVPGVRVEQGAELSEADLPGFIDLAYSDGSTGDLAIEWDADSLAAVDTSVSGHYPVTGTVKQTEFPTPFSDERADPTAYKFDFNGETKFLMVATKDLNLDPINNAGQPTGLPIRMADTIEGLSDEALDAGLVEEVDILSRGTLDSYGNAMTGCFWAPEIHEIAGTLSILFMPCYNANPDMWTGRASIIQLKKDGEGNHLDPTVPANWTAAKQVVRPNGTALNLTAGISLDMTYFEDSGTHYYSWQMLGANFIATFDPADPFTLTSDPVRIVVPEYAWDNTIAEGPNVHIENGMVYMLYSGSTVGDTYTTGLAYATAGEGVDLTDPAAWTKLNYPIQKSGPFNGSYQLGTGHGMWSEDEDGNLLYVFHARTSNEGLTGRDMFIRRVHFAADGMPVLDMETEEELLPELRTVTTWVSVGDASTAAWSFENTLADNYGAFAPATATGNRINNAGSISYVEDGVVGSALHLDGTSGVKLPDGLIQDDLYTVSMWLRPEALSGYTTALWGGLTEKWISFLPGGFGADAVLWAGTAWHDVFTGETLPLDQWTHVAFTVDGSAATVYINGEESATSAAFPETFTIPDAEFALGVNYWDAPFTGDIDELEVWSSVLSAAQVDALYMADYAGLDAALAAADALDRGMYSAATLAVVDDAVAAAGEVQGLNRTGQSQVDDAAAAVLAAIEGLESALADTSALEAVLAAAGAVDRDQFTGLTLNRLDGAIATGEALLDAVLDEQDAVDAAAAAVQAAVDALVKVPSLRDIATNPFTSEIVWLAKTGVTTGWATSVEGVADFRPLQNVNRDQMAAFLYRMAGEPEFTSPATATFADVPVGHVFFTEIEWLATQGITNGWEVDGVKYFRPTTAVNRDVMAAFLYRFAGSPDFEGTAQTFVDVPTTHVFYDEIEWLATTGITNGWDVDGVKQFRPTTAVKRDVMAAFLYRYADQFGM